MTNSTSATDSAPGFIGIQRAALDRAERAQRCVGLLRWALLITAAGATLFSSPLAAYIVASISLGITVYVTFVEHTGARARSLGERVRRLTLIAEGLGRSPPADELLEIRAMASDFENEALARDDANYFASRSGAGLPRFGEMLEESAFWTHHLLSRSERASWAWALVLMGGAGLTLLFALPLLSQPNLIAAGRLMCAVALFIMSRDVIGAALAYSRGTRAVNTVLHRLQSCAALGWPEDHLLRLFGDYNSAVESAPLPRPGLYNRYKQRINSLWATYKASK